MTNKLYVLLSRLDNEYISKLFIERFKDKKRLLKKVNNLINLNIGEYAYNYYENDMKCIRILTERELNEVYYRLYK